VLRVEDLRVHFPADGAGPVAAVNAVSLDVGAGDRVAVVGETGSGKSVMALAVFRLLPRVAVVHGRVCLDGTDLLNLSDREMAKRRGREMVLVPQNPLNCLNPVLSVGAQVEEAVRRTGSSSVGELKERVIDLLRAVGLPNPSRLRHAYPHELSGGMAQRVLLAIGLAGGRPRLVIADEPTKGLDAGAREQSAALMDRLFAQSALILITHDLGVTSICSRVAVMYAGEIVEVGPREAVLGSPLHPYTQGLVHAHPERGMVPIPGFTPSLTDLPAGCRFHPRCTRLRDECRQTHPEMRPVGHRMVRCFAC